MFWHRFKRSKKSKQYQNLEQEQPQVTQTQQPQSTPVEPQKVQEQAQNTKQSPQKTQQQPPKTQPTSIQTEYVAQPKPKHRPSSSSYRNHHTAYANAPVYVQQQPNTVYYVVEQPNTIYVQQRPQYVQDNYYQRSNFVDNALLFGTGLLLGDLLF